jgi:HAD superfamily hydrolase (TIGR01549 family)
MIKISAFDFDGTIANTIPITISIIKRFASSDYQKDLDDALIRKLRDKPIPEIFRALNVPIVKLPFIARKIRNEINKEIEHLKPIRGMRNVLAKLKEQGQILGIVSSNSRESIQKFLLENDMAMFDFVYTNSKVFGKSGSLKKLFREYDCRPEEVVYFGDEIRDIEAAREIGIKIVSVTWGVNSREKLVAYKPDYSVDSPSEIPGLFKTGLSSII